MAVLTYHQVTLLLVYNPFSIKRNDKKIDDNITFLILISGNRARGLIVSAWLISIVFSIPILILYEIKVVQGMFSFRKLNLMLP